VGRNHETHEKKTVRGKMSYARIAPIGVDSRITPVCVEENHGTILTRSGEVRDGVESVLPAYCVDGAPRGVSAATKLAACPPLVRTHSTASLTFHCVGQHWRSASELASKEPSRLGATSSGASASNSGQEGGLP
jgi:hypothetical protein